MSQTTLAKKLYLNTLVNYLIATSDITQSFIIPPAGSSWTQYTGIINWVFHLCWKRASDSVKEWLQQVAWLYLSLSVTANDRGSHRRQDAAGKQRKREAWKRLKREGGKSWTKVNCCNINGNTRIRIFLLIMPKLPGRVSGFSPPPCPGTPAASPQRRLPCRDELLTGPKTACLMLCQARHGAAGMLAASWPTPRITGLNPFYPSSSSSSLSF